MGEARVPGARDQVGMVYSAKQGGSGGVAAALKSVQTALRIWSKENFGCVTAELESLRGRLELLKADL